MAVKNVKTPVIMGFVHQQEFAMLRNGRMKTRKRSIGSSVAPLMFLLRLNQSQTMARADSPAE